MENRDNEPTVKRPLPEQQIMPPSTTTLLQELQIIWDEIGGSSNSRDKMLLKLEQDCLGLYKKKVEEARKYRAELQRLLADAEAEIASLMSALGEKVSFSRKEGSLTDQISTVKTLLYDLLTKKDLRCKEISETLTQIAEISSKIKGNGCYHDSSGPEIDESDLTQRKLDELRVQGYVRTMHKMWKLMETPMDERKRFNHISSLRSVKADDALKNGCLGLKRLKRK